MPPMVSMPALRQVPLVPPIATPFSPAMTGPHIRCMPPLSQGPTVVREALAIINTSRFPI